MSSIVNKRKRLNRPASRKQAVSIKLVPNKYSFATINLIFKHKRDTELEENEFRFLLASAVHQAHGEYANQAYILSYNTINPQNYRAILKFKTVHYSRFTTALLLFGDWKGAECKFEVVRIAQSPCFLSI